jgi:AcrR family transcriptional regulator
MAQPASHTTYERIMDAAFELFVAQGIHGTAITDIERAVGLTAGRGSFYKHFRSKDDLLAAVIEREISRGMAEALAAREALQFPQEPREAMKAACRQALLDMQRFSALFRLMVSEGDRVPAIREIFTQALRHGVELNDWIDDATRYVVISALVGYHTFELTGVDVYTDVDTEQFISALADLVPDARPPGVVASGAKGRSRGRLAAGK